MTTALGCSAQASETINVISTVTAPNTFTPNGDGINDLWQIPHLSDYTNSSLKIYNRLGIIIYESKGYTVPWNGTANGSNVPAGAYYYIIDLKDGSKPVTGEVTIIR
ncbi:gliding motility-associated C-terminal domain-containing protein [Mucilaginibacter ginkgonis]|uniref:Gliding motility-associated C-terminal domain-containing protein n=1 Tax=Mucilaginibacter ginkgonis TaxID=2682091 RepID=A0A6I4I1M8_9SPHI|nr:gliding motility-associated C-terminal domain-containing protein [Mucilaginibacter ginkgonis]QQL50660.1 gliding motility-associated C-terminal domain-containing protein [Mucilaginibacter ginkgonis]